MKYFAAVNIGSTDVTAVSARWNKNGDYSVEAFSRVPARGFSRGGVSEITAATATLNEVIKKLGQKRIKEIYAGVSSSSVSVMHGAGAVLVSKYGGEISESDVKQCAKIASTIKIPIDKEPIHKIIKSFTIDGEKGIKNPLNLEGVKLESEASIITVNSSLVRNMHKCVANAGFIPAGFVLSPVAASYRVLSEDDMQKGVMLLNLKKDITEVLIYHRGLLQDCRVFPVGTDDIVLSERKTKREALEDIYKSVLDVSDLKDVRKIVITGERDISDKLIEDIEEVFRLPVKTGTCLVRPFEKLPHERIGYIGTLGICDHIHKERVRNNISTNLLKRSFNKILNFLDKYF